MKKQLEPFKAYLISAGSGTLIEEEFSYRITQGRSFTQVTSGIIPLEFIDVKQTIYTSNVDLGFAKNKPVKLADGTIMTIDSVQENIDENVATFDGIGLVGYYLILNGGK